MGSGLNELATALKPAGIQLVFHNHVGSYVETEAETCRLLDETDPSLVGWCLDCGHLTYGGGDTLKMLEKYGNRVGHVHLKDVNGEILVRALEEQWSFHRALKAYIFAKLGDGIVISPRSSKRWRLLDMTAGLSSSRIPLRIIRQMLLAKTAFIWRVCCNDNGSLETSCQVSLGTQLGG